jgi:hypothetical protein
MTDTRARWRSTQNIEQSVLEAVRQHDRLGRPVRRSGEQAQRPTLIVV